MRLFIAINLPNEVKSYLEDIIFRIEKQNKSLPIKWAETQNLHLSIGFIENIEPENVNNLQNLLSENLKFSNFILALNQTGLFPNEQNPRVVKISLTDHNKQLQSIKNQIDEIFKKLNIPIDTHPFSPHITLGRIKKQNWRICLPEELEKLEFPVNFLDLMKSDLTPTGPIYTKLKTYAANT